ncbi:hypothetical protein [Kerstersia gyiorum]|uniref:Secreted protein n=1 Tax=Kerstersia gyiorum TaxID=206506 RepID=A0A171KUG9_9BURK|nr:hypothetical protein [Kerstersia gyiorum]KKO72536.1 hypothetical protein AAV32_05705 [Kerstersia gyiorum]
MSTFSFPRRALNTHVATVLALLLSSGAAQAFTEQAQFAPKPLLVFSGPASNGGNFPGATPFTPPIYIASQNRYVGMTQEGGDTWTGAWSAIFNGATFFQVGVDGAGYQYQTLGERIGVQNTPLLYDPKTGDIYGGAESALDENGLNPGGVLFVIREGQVLPLVNHGDELSAKDFQPRGQMTQDSQGRLFLNGGGGLANCSATNANRNSKNILYHFNPGAAQLLQPSANLCDFVEIVQRQVGTRLATYYRQHKGAVPQIQVWSEADQALYALASNSGSEENVEGVPSNDNKGKPISTLIRISAADLGSRLQPDDGDKIEVLHNFAKARDGEARAGMDYVSSMIEVGDWLYGTTYSATPTLSTSALGGTLWRIHKQQGTSSFEVVHRFGESGNGVEGDGSNPAGPLVRAADGNIYGTTSSDTRELNSQQTEALGAGILFRITTPEGDTPAYEPLAYFDVETTGARPAGLGLGPIKTDSDGKRHQTLIGVSRYGGNEGDTITTRESVDGFGTLFQLDVPVTDALLTRFVSNASSARPGTRPTLQWSSEGTERCVAGGDWEGTYGASGSYRLPALNELRDYVFTLQCSGYTGQTETKRLTVKVIDGSGTGESGNGGGGALAGGLLVALAAWAARRQARPAV